METLLHFVASLIAAVLDIVSLTMVIRMLVSLFNRGEDGPISIFLACVTEPFIAPVRFLLAKFNLMQNSPIDWSFTVSYLIIMLLRLFLPAIY